MGSGTARLLHAGAFLAALLVAAVQLAPVTHACAGANLSSDAPGRESGQAVASAEASPTLPVLTTLTIYSNVMRSVKPGAVILIHQTHPETLEALPRICRELRRRGYKMVTVSELAAQSEPR